MYDNDALNYCSYDGSALSDSYDPKATAVLTKPVSKYPQKPEGSSLTTYSTPQPKPKAIIRRDTCPHCQNATPLTLLYVYEYISDMSYMNPGGKLDIPAAYFVFMCGTCDELILYGSDSLYPDSWTFWTTGQSWAEPARYEKMFKNADDNKTGFYPVWPNQDNWIRDPSIPSGIREHYLNAVKNKDQPNIFVAQIRAAVEATSDDRGVESGPLSERLEKLASQNNLPPVFVSIANELRVIGNIGAHAGNRRLNSDCKPSLQHCR